MKRRVEKKRFARLLAGDRWLYTRRQGRHDRWSVAGADAVSHARAWEERVNALMAGLARTYGAVQTLRMILEEADHG